MTLAVVDVLRSIPWLFILIALTAPKLNASESTALGRGVSKTRFIPPLHNALYKLQPCKNAGSYQGGYYSGRNINTLHYYSKSGPAKSYAVRYDSYQFVYNIIVQGKIVR
jgi:hypothetical protein